MQQDTFNQLMDQLERQMKITEWDFTSSVPVVGPLIATFRRGWNNISTRWVLRHYARQQLEFHRSLVGLLRETQQQLNEAHMRLIHLEQTTARSSTLHETFTRDIEMLAKHSLRQTSHATKE